MAASFLLGIDAGTTVIKSTLFTLDGHEVAGAAYDSSLLVPRPGWAEADMDVVWQAVVTAVQDTLRRAAVQDAALHDAPASVRDALRSPGQPLDAKLRADLEPRLGNDFSHVRVHTDSRAAASVRAFDARAYAIGRNIVFGAGHYAPATDRGRRLLAHELTHVVQNRG